MSYGFGYDEEAIYQDADIEQAQFEAEGARYGALLRKSRKARADGDLAKAASLCPHGGGYPLDSPAATNSDDPNAGETGYRCSECGSRLSASPWDGGTVVTPCETRGSRTS